MVAIGDELLSGRTQDKNIAHLARVLNLTGIDLAEVRIVADDSQAIGEAVNALRARHAYVFTSGGIGPTHDDITADAIAVAFGVDIDFHPETMELMARHYASRDMEFTEPRKRMARLPAGAEPIDNPVSVAPGFRIENVHVLAGVPAIFQAMLDNVVPTLKGGRAMLSRAIDCPHGEGTIAQALGEIAAEHREVSIGSYPRFDGVRYSTQIVVRGRDDDVIEAAAAAVETMLVRYRRR